MKVLNEVVVMRDVSSHRKREIKSLRNTVYSMLILLTFSLAHLHFKRQRFEFESHSVIDYSQVID